MSGIQGTGGFDNRGCRVIAAAFPMRRINIFRLKMREPNANRVRQACGVAAKRYGDFVPMFPGFDLEWGALDWVATRIGTTGTSWLVSWKFFRSSA